MKKAVDKRSPRWYDVKVACDNGTKRTLIIKQWNNLERFVREEFSSRKAATNTVSLWNRSDYYRTQRSKLPKGRQGYLAWLSSEKDKTWEFDPGSGWTLAACLTHASRTKHFIWFSSEMKILWLSGGRVSNAWITCLIQGDNSRKRLLIPHKRTVPHGTVWKAPVVWDGSASD